jgi:hypothetical protein
LKGLFLPSFMQAVFRKNCIACLNTKRIDQIPICRDDDKERGLTKSIVSPQKLNRRQRKEIGIS